MKQKIIFYTTLGCHLCDLGREVYQSTLNPEFFVVEEVDIAETDQLIDQYGTRIPVLQIADTGATLGWPFDARAVIDFLS